MPQVSKYPVSKLVYERIFDVFLKTLAGLKTKKQVSGFLNDFLTPTEQVVLSKRLAIAFLLSKGYSYDDIVKILRVSRSTIGFVSLDLKDGDNYKLVIEKLMKNEEIAEFMDNIGAIITSILSAGGSKSGTWRYLNSEIQKRKGKKVF